MNNVNNVNNFDSVFGLVNTSCFLRSSHKTCLFFPRQMTQFWTHLDPSNSKRHTGRHLEVTKWEIAVWISIRLTNAPPHFAHYNCRRAKQLPLMDTWTMWTMWTMWTISTSFPNLRFTIHRSKPIRPRVCFVRFENTLPPQHFHSSRTCSRHNSNCLQMRLSLQATSCSSSNKPKNSTLH